MVVELLINKVPISGNKFLRLHWAERKLLVDEWRKLVREYALVNRLDKYYIDRPEKRRVEITLYKKRLLDKDNAYTSCKMVVDALKCYKDKITGKIIPNFIYDDSSKYLELVIDQVKDNEEKILIRIC